MALLDDGIAAHEVSNSIRRDTKTDIVVSTEIADHEKAAKIISSQDEGWTYPYPTDFELSSHAVDEWKPLKVRTDLMTLNNDRTESDRSLLSEPAWLESQLASCCQPKFPAWS